MSENKLKITDADTAFQLSLEHEMRFTTTGNLHGAPVPGIKAGDRGLLPEPYHKAAEEAQYAVFHYETPIIWKGPDGVWYAPMHVYSGRTSTYRNKMMRALSLAGIRVVPVGVQGNILPAADKES